MRTLLASGLAVAALAMTLPAWSQTNMPQSGPQAHHASHQLVLTAIEGTSGAGIAGMPGSKSGPTVTPNGRTTQQLSAVTRLQDQSGVAGLPGSKSGPTVTPSQGQSSLNVVPKYPGTLPGGGCC